MTSPTKVLMIALDACDHTTVRAMAQAGELPTLAKLLRTSASATNRNPYGLYVGTVWPTFTTGRFASHLNPYCWEQIDPKNYELRMVTASTDANPFWDQIAAAGRRIALIDVPHSRAGTPMDGVMISEYGCHDRHFGFRTWPAELAEEIESQYGLHPILTTDPYSVREFAPDDWIHRDEDLRQGHEERELLAGMLEGLDRKAKLNADLLARGGWDLFLTVFGESHSIGHQSWHLHDPNHPRHDAGLVADMGDPLVQVYRRLDGAVEQLLRQVDDDTTVLVLLSHGMGPHYDGSHLLHEITRRLDRAADGRLGGTSRMDTAKRLWARLPSPVRKVLTPLAVRALRRRLAGHQLPPVDDWSTPQERAAQRFFLAPNNTAFGGVRINLVGREPQGKVAPGAEYDAVCAQLIEDLLALVNLDTGRPVVREASRTDAHYPRDEGDELPDVLIDWARDAPVERIWSPKTGIVHRSYTHWRTGDHTEQGLLLASGPGLPQATAMPEVDMMDLGVTVAALCGVELTGELDGKPVQWLASAPAKVTG